MNNATANERHIICKPRCESKDRERVRDLILQFVEPARAQPGCRYHDLYPRVDAPDAFFILDDWVDQAAVGSHAAHQHRRGDERTRTAVDVWPVDRSGHAHERLVDY